MLVTLCTRLALAMLGHGSPAVTAQTPAVAVVVDTEAAADPVLTVDEVTRHIALRKALQAYWQDPAHAALLQVAQATLQRRVLHFGPSALQVPLYDYPALVPRDPALAAIFAAHQYDPRQYASIQVAVVHAVGALELTKTRVADLPAGSTVLGQNVAVVQPYLPPLRDYAGITVHFVYADPAIALTADQMTHYIVVKQALRAYWRAGTHTDLLVLAQATQRKPPFQAGAGGIVWDQVPLVYNYPLLVTKDPGLAAIFTAQHLAPEVWEETQVAVYQAWLDLFMDRTPSEVGAVAARNNDLVRARIKELEAVGVFALQDFAGSGELVHLQRLFKTGAALKVNPMDP